MRRSFILLLLCDREPSQAAAVVGYRRRVSHGSVSPPADRPQSPPAPASPSRFGHHHRSAAADCSTCDCIAPRSVCFLAPHPHSRSCRSRCLFDLQSRDPAHSVGARSGSESCPPSTSPSSHGILLHLRKSRSATQPPSPPTPRDIRRPPPLSRQLRPLFLHLSRMEAPGSKPSPDMTLSRYPAFT